MFRCRPWNVARNKGKKRMNRIITREGDEIAVQVNDTSARTSNNFSAAKGAAVITVMIGHYTDIPNFWVVVSVALLIFSITSGYFTWQRYHGEFLLRKFWRRKLVRLLPQLFVIEIFLFALFLVQDQPGLWSWHTVINLSGMNGFLNWFRIPNQSPYGAGMWFLTLLIIFYGVYPLMEMVFRRKASSLFITVMGCLCFFLLNTYVLYSHAVWLTATGFIVGIFIARRQIKVSLLESGIAVFISGVGMMTAHWMLHFDSLNFFLFYLLELELSYF
jgi:uncharacterized protein YneF (UPF0154 family)